MKKAIFIAIAMVSAPSLSLAGFQIPRGVHTVETLDEARAEAVKEQKGLAFVLSDRNTTCGLCIDASLMAFKKLKSKSVVVYLDSKEAKSWQRVSPMVMTGFHGKEMGNTIPKVAVTSPDMQKLWVQMNNKDLGNEGNYRDTGKDVDAIQKGEKQPTDPKTMMIHWPLKGTSERFVGRFENLKGDNQLSLRMEASGKVAHIPLNRFTDESVAFARNLAGGGSGPEKADTSEQKAPEVEAWTGSNGKVLQAKFVNLDGESVTLQTVDGKSHTMPLTKLAADSQELAKKRAGQGPK